MILGKTRWRALNIAALVLLSVPCLMPLFWMVSTSLKGDEQIFVRGEDALHGISWRHMLPSPVHWDNYIQAMSFVPFGAYLKNTLLLCTVCSVGAVLSSAIVAFGFTHFRFRGRGILFVLMIASIALPGQVVMIPVFLLFMKLGLYNTYWPLIIPCFLGIPFYIFLMVQFFRTIPRELFEAAIIDGLHEWGVLWRIVLPLSRPVLATCALFQFLGQWNDFFGPLIYINDPEKYTLAYGLQQFMGSYGGKWSYLMAASTVFTIPIIVLFFFAQRTFIQGISTTGLK